MSIDPIYCERCGSPWADPDMQAAAEPCTACGRGVPEQDRLLGIADGVSESDAKAIWDQATDARAPVSYAAEVIADSSGKFCGNSLRFATAGEAETYVQDLKRRWWLVTETRVVQSDDPVNYRINVVTGRAQGIEEAS